MDAPIIPKGKEPPDEKSHAGGALSTGEWPGRAITSPVAPNIAELKRELQQELSCTPVGPVSTFKTMMHYTLHILKNNKDKGEESSDEDEEDEDAEEEKEEEEYAEAAKAVEADSEFAIRELAAPGGDDEDDEDEVAGGKGQDAAEAEEEDAAAEEDEKVVEDPFYVVDLGLVARKYAQWVRLFPRVIPFYAVKCNPDPGMIRTLAKLGTGFDCASKQEIQQVMSVGADPSRIIYANPCKALPEIRFALSKGVSVMTFDNAAELRKMKDVFPDAELLLRIRTEDSHAKVSLGKKFGAELRDVESLVKLCRELGLRLIGVSFHVGSGCSDVDAYRVALESARKVFDVADKIGQYKLRVLDIGGGFPGCDDDKISAAAVAAVLNPLLDKLFPPSPNLTIISEPGRYFAEASHMLCVEVIGKYDAKLKIVDSLPHSKRTSEANSYMSLSGSPSNGKSPLLTPGSKGSRLLTQKAMSMLPPMSLGLPRSAVGDTASYATTTATNTEADGEEGSVGASSALPSESQLRSPIHQLPPAQTKNLRFFYTINEGVYGSFKDRVLLDEKFKPRILYSKRLSQSLMHKRLRQVLQDQLKQKAEEDGVDSKAAPEPLPLPEQARKAAKAKGAAADSADADHTDPDTTDHEATDPEHADHDHEHGHGSSASDDSGDEAHRAADGTGPTDEHDGKRAGVRSVLAQINEDGSWQARDTRMPKGSPSARDKLVSLAPLRTTADGATKVGDPRSDEEDEFGDITKNLHREYMKLYKTRYPSKILGPTNHPMDVISKCVRLPEIGVGDWLYFTRMGAYTISLASCFNGHEKPTSYYVWTEADEIL